jgi:penicillin amidase
LNRFLKYINIIVALLLVLAAGAVWFVAIRVLPQTSGSIPAPVAARVAIGRDALGVPHIVAGSIEDAVFAQGYVTAQDRLFQIEFMRRQGAGTLAEIFGRPALESDALSRRLRLRRVAEQYARGLRDADRRMLSAFARGVNYFIETHLGAYPIEFTLLGSDPAPWTLSDSVLVSLIMYRVLTDSWRDELVKRAMLETGEKNLVNALFPFRTGLEPRPGSNAWVIAGSRTQTGKPLLASDPHLSYSLPSIWYQVHLKAPGLNVAGVSLPGLPGVVIGHNDRIAWGMTNVGFDVQDLYEVSLDTTRGLYRDGGKAVAARQERETIRIRGGGAADTVVWSTRFGPIVTSEGARHYALRWAAFELSPFELPVLDMNRAGNWTEFTAALARFPGPAQNVVYADTEGNIGFHVVGRFPIRKELYGDLPVPAGAADAEWSGYVPFEELPSLYNPSSGAIVTANQNPFPEKYPYRVSGGFASHHRAHQIRAMLDKRSKWTAAAFLAVQKDVYSAFHHYLAKQLVAAGGTSVSSHPLLAQAVPLLRDWNGQMEIGRPEPLLVTLAFQHLRKAVAERASPDKAGAYDEGIAYDVIETLLRSRSADWFADWDQLLRRVLLDAAEEAARMQGQNPDNWDYGRYHQLLLKNPVLGDLRFVGKYFRIGPAPLSGAPTTVKQVSGRVGPSMRFIADVSSWDASLMNLSTGQSAQPLSSQYKNQWSNYYAGQSYSMQFDRVDVVDSVDLVPLP